jgi:hypothetical protein
LTTFRSIFALNHGQISIHLMLPSADHKAAKKRRRLTDAFQVFCAENRPDIKAQNPTDHVGVITSRLAAIWRSMPRESKMVYVDFAKRFDLNHGNVGKRKVRPIRGVKHEFMIPLIHVVRRSESSAAAESASLSSLYTSMGDQMETMKEETWLELAFGRENAHRVSATIETGDEEKDG